MTGSERSRGNAWAVGSLVRAGLLLAVVPSLIGAQVLAQPRSWHWGPVVGHCWPLLGGIAGVIIGRLVKRPEQRRAEWAGTTAVWSGSLPVGADIAEWRRMVHLQAREAAVTGWGLLVLGVGGGVLTTVAAARTGHDAAGLWGLAVVQVISAVALIGACFRMARNGRRLFAELRPEG